MPFAFLGVLLLLTSGLSIAYISALQSQSVRDRIVQDIVQKSNKISALVHRQVETEAHWIGSRAVHYGGSNHSMVISIYERMMESYLGEVFPREIKGFHLEISNHSSSILLENRVLSDFEESVRVENDTFDDQTFEELETDRSGYWMELQRTMTFSVAGHITYVLSKDEIVTRNTHEFSEELSSLFPFLKSKMGTLLSDSISELGNVARMLKYMLSTLAQVRVLEGWGGSEPDTPSIDEIITPEDVERAVNLALLLEHFGLLRSMDGGSIEAFDLHNPEVGEGNSLIFLLRTWLGKGTIDPSDLFILYENQGKAKISIDKMISQGIYAMADQTTLKYFDYFGLTPIADLSLHVSEMVANAIQDFLDWASGNEKEAWLARSWFKDIAKEMKTSTLTSYPILYSIPKSDFQITTESSGTINFSLSGFDAYIPFEVVDIAKNFDSFWRSCFHLIYGRDLRIVHESQRDLVEDMAIRIGEIAEEMGTFSEVSLGSIIPADDVSILQDLSEAIRRKTSGFTERIAKNQSFVDSLIQNLWKAQANLTINVISRIESEIGTFVGNNGIERANQTILQSLIDLVEKENDYWILNEQEKNRLAEMIEKFVLEKELGIGAHNLLLNQTLTRLREMTERAISLETPSRDGGIYSKLRDFVISSSGVLAEAAEAVRKLTDSIAESEDVENIRFLISTTMKPFQFWDGSADPARDGLSKRNFTVQISSKPAYLSGRIWKDDSPTGSLRVGDLWIAVKNPVAFPAGSGNNVHYTDLTRFSSAPYTSTWRIKVKGLTELSIVTNLVSQQIMGYEDRVTKSVPIEFEIAIITKSGWPLEGVSYESSNTFLEDIWDVICRFLESVWNGLLKVIDWILDGVSKIFSLVSKLIGTLLSYAQDILRAIEKVVEVTTELLRSSISSIAGFVGGLIEGVLSLFGRPTFQISAFGGDLRIGLNQGNGTILKGEIEIGSLKVTLLLSKLADMNLTEEQRKRAAFEYDAIVNLNISLCQLDFRGTFDPAMVVQENFFQAEVEWGDEWKIDFEVPYLEKYLEKRYMVQIPSIPTPIGTVDIELGFLLKLKEDLGEIDILGTLSGSFESAWAETLEEEVSIDSAARFVELGISNAILELARAIESNINRVIEVVLYLEGQIKVGATAGAGVRLACIISRSVLNESFHWLSKRFRSFISSFGRPPSTNVESDLSRVMASETFIGFGVIFSLAIPRLVNMIADTSQLEVEVLLVVPIQVNVAMIGSLLGKDLGLWRIDFGICLEGIPPSFVGETAHKGEVVDIWLLHGTAVQLA